MILLLSALSLIDISYPFSNNIDDGCDNHQKQVITTHFSFTEPIGNCVGIYDSIFIGIVNAGPGGAIYFHNEEYNSSIFVAHCTFTNCASEESDGGAIQSTSKSNQLIYCCGHQCSAFSSGQFAYLCKLSDSTSEINVTSFVYAGSSSIDFVGESVIDNNVNDQQFYQINVSNCELKQNDGTGSFKIAGNSNAVLKETSIYNISSKGYILTLNSYNCKTEIQRINIISNTVTKAIIFFNGHKTIKETIFCNNQAENVAKGSGLSSTLLLLYCVFDGSPALPSNVNTNNCQFDTYTETYKIGLLDTYLCHAEYTATPYHPPDDDEDGGDDSSVWKNKGVIGALSGGIAGALVLGIVIGAVVVCIIKKKNSYTIASQPLLTTEKQ